MPKDEKNIYPDIDSIARKLLADDGMQRGKSANFIGMPMPSADEIYRLVDEVRGIMFPAFFGARGLPIESLRHVVSSSLDGVYRLLSTQIRLCISFVRNYGECDLSESDAYGLAAAFVDRLPDIRYMLYGDATAAYNGDPAAKSVAETILCYPSVRIMTKHRVAHELYRLNVPMLPRMISEIGHAVTGIDIHPGASIGQEFFIDHGTGVVIGETAIIGARCTLYQGVTLGALSFPKDAEGNPIKGQPRHPILGDDVTIYSNTTVLGRVTIGSGSLIGGNIWITKDVPPGSKVIQSRSTSPDTSEKMLGSIA